MRISFRSIFHWLLQRANRKAELVRALVDSEARFRALVGNVPGAVFRIANDAQFTVQFMSDGIVPIAGYTPEDFKNQDVHDFIHHSHPDGSRHNKANCPIVQGLRKREGVRIRDDVFWKKDKTEILGFRYHIVNNSLEVLCS